MISARNKPSDQLRLFFVLSVTQWMSHHVKCKGRKCSAERMRLLGRLASLREMVDLKGVR
jgi:hypothetical protein